jgi:hypothetical protein
MDYELWIMNDYQLNKIQIKMNRINICANSDGVGFHPTACGAKNIFNFQFSIFNYVTAFH